MNKENHLQLKWFKIISIAAIFLGIVLLAYMVIGEDEPGAIPLLLILSGIIGYFISRKLIKKK